MGLEREQAGKLYMQVKGGNKMLGKMLGLSEEDQERITKDV